MDADDIRAFLYKLATDTDYRARFEQDPIGVAAEVGITIDPSEIPPGGVKLPSGAEILGRLDDLVKQLAESNPPGTMIHFIWMP
jgi:hypothetical protein